MVLAPIAEVRTTKRVGRHIESISFFSAFFPVCSYSYSGVCCHTSDIPTLLFPAYTPGNHLSKTHSPPYRRTWWSSRNRRTTGSASTTTRGSRYPSASTSIKTAQETCFATKTSCCTETSSPRTISTGRGSNHTSNRTAEWRQQQRFYRKCRDFHY